MVPTHARTVSRTVASVAVLATLAVAVGGCARLRRTSRQDAPTLVGSESVEPEATFPREIHAPQGADGSDCPPVPRRVRVMPLAPPMLPGGSHPADGPKPRLATPGRRWTPEVGPGSAVPLPLPSGPSAVEGPLPSNRNLPDRRAFGPSAAGNRSTDGAVTDPFADHHRTAPPSGAQAGDDRAGGAHNPGTGDDALSDPRTADAGPTGDDFANDSADSGGTGLAADAGNAGAGDPGAGGEPGAGGAGGDAGAGFDGAAGNDAGGDFGNFGAGFDGGGGGAGDGLAVGQAAIAPSMFGDQFGGGGRLAVPVAALAGRGIPGGATPAAARQFALAGAIPDRNGTGPAVFDAVRTAGGFDFVGDRVTVAVENQTRVLEAPTRFRSVGTVPDTPRQGQRVALAENPRLSAAFAEAARAVVGPGGTVRFNAAGNAATFLNPEAASVAVDYDFLGPAGQATGVPVTTDVPGLANPQPSVVFSLPNPATGGIVGITKLADDNSPMPRDRLTFAYDHYNTLAITPDGFDVHRFAPGIEKTFAGGRGSVEVRLPFASTLTSDLRGVTNERDVELGNLSVTTKLLLADDGQTRIAGGLAFQLPTADDTRVLLADGAPLARIANETVVLTPYLAGLWTSPDQLWFAQLWSAVRYDLAGNPVLLDPDGAGLRAAGVLHEQSVFQADVQVGRWLVRRDPGDPRRLRGLAPLVELHYNTSLADPDYVALDDLVVGDFAGNRDELNLTLALAAQFGDRLVATGGLVLPLRDDDDALFDYQLGLRLNWYFGRPQAAPNTF